MLVDVPKRTKLLIPVDEWQEVQDTLADLREQVQAMADEFTRLGHDYELAAVMAALEGRDGDVE
jgi:hypothetical protein